MTCSDCSGEGSLASQKCSKCAGAGVVKKIVNFKVKIPAGIDDGQSIRLVGQGEAGIKGANAGDLYLRIRVHPDKRLERDGFNILSKVEISFTLAALGGKIEVETVDGPVKMKIPEGTQSGVVFKLKDKGVPYLNKRGRGDHLVEVIVKTPVKLSKKQKDLLEELGKEGK